MTEASSSSSSSVAADSKKPRASKQASSSTGRATKKRKVEGTEPQKTSTVIVNTVVEAPKKKKDPSPRSLLTMWIQLKNYDATHKTNDWANFKEEHPTIYLMLKGRERNGGSEFEGGRRFNKLLRATWKYIHGKDPVALEEAITIATPTPRKKKEKAASDKKDEKEEGEVSDDGSEGEEEDEDE